MQRRDVDTYTYTYTYIPHNSFIAYLRAFLAPYIAIPKSNNTRTSVHEGLEGHDEVPHHEVVHAHQPRDGADAEAGVRGCR